MAALLLRDNILVCSSPSSLRRHSIHWQCRKRLQRKVSSSSISSFPDSVLQKNVKPITEPIWAKTYLSIWKGGNTKRLKFFTYPRQFLRSRAPWVGYVCASLLNCGWDHLQSKGMVHGMEWQHFSTSPRRWEDESRV